MPAVLTDNARPGVTVVTLNRPERLNAMNVELVDGLHDALDAVAADEACRVVVLTGAGRGFCAGLDLGGFAFDPDRSDRGASAPAPSAPATSGAASSDADPSTPSAGPAGRGDRVRAGFATQTRIASLVPKLRSLPQPVIAAVNGPASGGGLALALASDVRIGAASCRFNVAFVKLGLSGCDIGVSWLLPRVIGASRAWELMLTGRLIDAAEADRVGLVLKVVPDDRLLDAAFDTAAQIAANSPWGVRMTKEVMWSQLEVGSLQAGIDLENRTQVLSSMTGDMVEAVRAFAEKRPPRFEAPSEPGC